jgi:hypothetical protein
MPSNKQPASKKPLPGDVLDAGNFTLLLSQMAEHFEEVHMHAVSRHLISARKEIERIWKENDFSAHILGNGSLDGLRRRRAS